MCIKGSCDHCGAVGYPLTSTHKHDCRCAAEWGWKREPAPPPEYRCEQPAQSCVGET
jgi:hypothetical protein